MNLQMATDGKKQNKVLYPELSFSEEVLQPRRIVRISGPIRSNS
jgi:hypothetical protein